MLNCSHTFNCSFAIMVLISILRLRVTKNTKVFTQGVPELLGRLYDPNESQSFHEAYKHEGSIRHNGAAAPFSGMVAPSTPPSRCHRFF